MRVYAHRGASAYAPQNTLPAFRKALEMNADGIELDVQLSADGVPVVIHDFVMNRTSDGKGFVHALSWKEIRKADAGSWFSSDFEGIKVPSLEEVLSLVPPEICLNIEIKSISSLGNNIAQVIAELAAQEKGRNLIVSSFNHRVLKEFQELSPGTPIGILTGSDLIDFPAYVDRSGLNPFSIHPVASCLSSESVEEAHSRGWQVMTYTINSKEEARMVQSLGADIVFSDYPDLLEN